MLATILHEKPSDSAEIQPKKEKQTYVSLSHKFDTVANGKHLTGYAWVKQQQLAEDIKNGNVVTLDYADIVNSYKTAKDIESFQ